jgi:predicted DNA-binding protein
MKNKKYISLNMSPEMYVGLQAIALQTKSSKADVLRRAFTLYYTAMKDMGFIDEVINDDKIIDF